MNDNETFFSSCLAISHRCKGLITTKASGYISGPYCVRRSRDSAGGKGQFETGAKVCDKNQSVGCPPAICLIKASDQAGISKRDNVTTQKHYHVST